MAQRIAQFKIYGYGGVYGNSADQIAQQIANDLANSGWGISDFSGQTYYGFWVDTVVNLGVIVSTDVQIAQIQQVISSVAASYLNTVSVEYEGDQNVTSDGSGHLIVTDTYIDRQTKPAPQPSLWNELFGDSSAVDAGGKLLGLSVGTIALLGIGYILLDRLVLNKK
jgi:hypothetical protein